MSSGYRVAVVGGGIFGATAAIQLAREGHRVVLFERADDLLTAATTVNQRRLHRGYHYPRSDETALNARRSAGLFEAEFPHAVQHSYDHFVALSKRDSLVDAGQYLEFCRRNGLEISEEYPPFLRRSAVEVSLRVREATIDIDELRAACWRKLTHSGVEVRLRHNATRDELIGFERAVVATYSSINFLGSALSGNTKDYQFEVCEKPVVHLPEKYRNSSMVILDGPFMCIDPAQVTGQHLFGNVAHAIHATTIGRFPLIPASLIDVLNKGVIRKPPCTRFPAFLEAAKEYFTGLERTRYIGSMYTVRAVLPNVEKTDRRPTLVEQLDERTTTIFGGKIVNSVEAAHRVARHLAHSDRPLQDVAR